MKPSSRALARIARRGIAKAPGRSLLIITLIALLVGIGVFTAVSNRSVSLSAQDQFDLNFGQAETVIGFDVVGGLGVNRSIVSRTLMDRPALAYDTDGIREPENTAADSARFQTAGGIDAVVGVLDEPVLVARRAMIEGAGSGGIESASPTVYVEVDLAHPASEGLIGVVEGRVPAARDEVAIASRRGELTGLTIGDQLPVGEELRTIVGLVGTVSRFGSDFVLVSPGGFEALDLVPSTLQYRLFVDIEPVDQSRVQSALEEIVGHEVAMVQRSSAPYSSTRVGAALGSTLISIMLATQVILVGAFTFAVSIRRRMAEIGRLSTIGADGGHLRRLVRYEALWLGAAGVVIGTALACALVAVGIRVGWISQDLPFGGRGDRAFPEFRWNVIDLAGPALVGLIAVTVAARWPARRLDSLSVSDVLARDLSPETPKWTDARLGGGLILVGLVLVGFGAKILGQWVLLAALVSVVAIFAGIVILGGNVVALVGRRADQLPLVPRLVTRDAERNRARSATIITAFCVILSVPVFVGAWIDQDPNGVADELVRVEAWRSTEDMLFADNAQLAAIGSELDQAAEEELGATSHAALIDVGSSLVVQQSEPGDQLEGRSVRTDVYVATPALIELLNVPDELVRQLDDDTIIDVYRSESTGFGRSIADGTGGLFTSSATATTQPGQVFLGSSTQRPVDVVSAQGIGLSDTALVSAPMAETFGASYPAGRIYRADSPPSNDQLAAFKLRASEILAAHLGLDEEEGKSTVRIFALGSTDNASSSDQTRVFIASIGAAMILALAVAALSSVEIEKYVRTMLAVGGEPRLRRKLLGAQTLYFLLVAAVFAVMIAMLLFNGLYSYSSVGPQRVVIPWIPIGVVLIGMPVIVSALIAGIFRNGTPALSRRLT